MLNFEIIPHEGVGPVKFGMKVHEVKAVMGNPEDIQDNRHYYLSGFMVDFNTSGKVEFIELADSPKFQAKYHGMNLHKLKSDEALNYVSQFDTFDADDPELGFSYIFKKLQLVLWRGTLPEDAFDGEGAYFEAVGIASDNYFD